MSDIWDTLQRSLDENNEKVSARISKKAIARGRDLEVRLAAAEKEQDNLKKRIEAAEAALTEIRKHYSFSTGPGQRIDDYFAKYGRVDGSKVNDGRERE